MLLLSRAFFHLWFHQKRPSALQHCTGTGTGTYFKYQNASFGTGRRFLHSLAYLVNENKSLHIELYEKSYLRDIIFTIFISKEGCIEA